MNTNIVIWLLLSLSISISTEANRGGRSPRKGSILKDGSFSHPLSALHSFISDHQLDCNTFPKKNEKGKYVKSCSEFRGEKRLHQAISQLSYFELEDDKYIVAFTEKPFTKLLVLKKAKLGLSLVIRSSRPLEIIKFCTNEKFNFCKSSFIDNLKKGK
ncbi:MAG: hypothetical protein BM556_15270 [Bacteriovorax sp. MedPE-SWde]|nr:MAG: hypothetical protein BM556_15270 [Bacteriovorax sp. MedPE-SWde]